MVAASDRTLSACDCDAFGRHDRSNTMLCRQITRPPVEHDPQRVFQIPCEQIAAQAHLSLYGRRRRRVGGAGDRL